MGQMLSKSQYLLASWVGRWKQLTCKTLIFGNFWGPSVVGSSLYQKNIYSLVYSF